ncbi:ester cyclase [Nocardia sp. CA-128927]|uniref:ester cyclase n=1 Tax=Nocardia sp. CA-128927 TaxID=3239975 RepID=UPI003D96CB41
METQQNSTTTSTDARLAAQRLLDGWLILWNGDYTLADDILAQDFALHAALLGGGDDRAVRGPDGLIGWIKQTRAAFTELVFTVEVGPIVDLDHLAIRWVAVGTYGAGFPGATAAPGTPVRFTGTDILRIEQSKIAEYWVNSDVHVLLATLGVQL